jgi:hypothetical protein
MRILNRSRQYATTSDRAGRNPSGPDRRSSRRASPRLIADAVIASYLHDISQRHRHAVRVPIDAMTQATAD